MSGQAMGSCERMLWALVMCQNCKTLCGALRQWREERIVARTKNTRRRPDPFQHSEQERQEK